MKILAVGRWAPRQAFFRSGHRVGCTGEFTIYYSLYTPIQSACSRVSAGFFHFGFAQRKRHNKSPVSFFVNASICDLENRRSKAYSQAMSVHSQKELFNRWRPATFDNEHFKDKCLVKMITETMTEKVRRRTCTRQRLG